MHGNTQGKICTAGFLSRIGPWIDAVPGLEDALRSRFLRAKHGIRFQNGPARLHNTACTPA